tara:strand:+ start:201 stop:998 length:798 start_codon:yes stop_codon:yes gene_type:complete
MAQIDLGSIKFNWKGSYSGATAYVVDDVVESSGSSYICILATTGNAPPNATYWEQMSSAGTNGTDGTDLTTTLTTQGDIVYRDGSGLARLGAGTSGQALVTQGTGANPIWSTVGGTNTPAWSAYRNGNIDITHSTFVTVPYNAELFDTDGAFDTSTYRFTVPSGKAGKYLVQFSVNIGGIGDNNTVRRYTKLRKNGSDLAYGLSQDLTADADAINHDTSDNTVIVDLAEGDYLEVQAYHTVVSGEPVGRILDGGKATRFSGFKLL